MTDLYLCGCINYVLFIEEQSICSDKYQERTGRPRLRTTGLLSRLARSVVVELFGTFLYSTDASFLRLSVVKRYCGHSIYRRTAPMPTMTVQPARVFNGPPCAPSSDTKSSICCQINRRTLMPLSIRFIPSCTKLRMDRSMSADQCWE